MTAPAIVAAVDPDSWRHAPLFVGGSTIALTAGSVQPNGRSEAADEANSATDPSAVAPPPNGLFVARSSAGRPQ